MKKAKFYGLLTAIIAGGLAFAMLYQSDGLHRKAKPDVVSAVGEGKNQIDLDELKKTGWYKKMFDRVKEDFHRPVETDLARLKKTRLERFPDSTLTQAIPDRAILINNPANQLAAYFTDEGPTVLETATTDHEITARLRGSEIRRAVGGSAELGRTEATVDGDRVVYSRDGVREWFHNRLNGIEHGFDIDDRPAGSGNVEIEVEVSGLSPRLSDDGGYVRLEDGAGAEALRYANLVVKDAAGTDLPAYMAVRDQKIALVFDDEAAVYPVFVDPIISTPSWSDVGSDTSRYGVSLSGAGDFNQDGYADIIIAADLYDNGANYNIGKAYLYYGSATGPSGSPDWTYVGGNNYDKIDSAIGVGDVNCDGAGDIALGQIGYTYSTYTDSGQVLLFLGGDDGDETPDWEWSPANTGANLGSVISGVGDINGDGCADFIVGAPLYSTPSPGNEGAAFLFYGDAVADMADPGVDCDSDSMCVRWEGTTASENFGNMVAGLGDTNGDGYDDFAIGARFNDDAGTNRGKVWVYEGSSSGPVSDGNDYEGENNGDYFGSGIGGVGDIDGDGYPDMIVGAPGYNVGSDNISGKIYVYEGSASGFSATPSAGFASKEGGGEFGRLISSAGDANGDGYADVIVSSYSYQLGTGDTIGGGRAFVYPGSATGLATSYEDSVTLYGETAGNNFGFWISSAGDANGDGFSDVLIGAYKFDGGLSYRGKAYFYNGVGRTLNDSPDTSFTKSGVYHFGLHSENAGDVNGDGFDDIIVASDTEVYIYEGDETGLQYGSPAQTIDGITSSQRNFVTGNCDVNGDGYDDIIISQAGIYPNNLGFISAYYGSSTGLSGTEHSVFTGSGSYWAERSLDCAGDFNGDGFDDVIVRMSFDRFRVYFGSASGLTTYASISAGGLESLFAYHVAGIGDFDGNGIDDIAISLRSSSTSKLRIYPGDLSNSSSGLADPYDDQYISSTYPYPNDVAGIGDINGDGFGDVALLVSSSTVTKILICLGNDTDPDSPTTFTLEYDESGAAAYQNLIDGLGDINGDGCDDFALTKIDSLYEAKVVFGHPEIDTLDQADISSWNYTLSGTTSPYEPAGGDLNGDGFADLFFGDSSTYMRVFYGGANEAKTGVYAQQTTAPYGVDVRFSPGSATNTSFKMNLHERSTIGRTKANIMVEMVPAGEPFALLPASVTAPTSYSDTTTQITTYTATSTTNASVYKWRARLMYDPSRMYNGQVGGRWFKPSRTPAHGFDARIVE